jgi:HK97 family phage major capsid protein
VAQYSNLTSRTDSQALMPEEVANDLIRRATDESAVLTMFRRIPVSRGQVRLPILSALPTAYWVTGDVGLKQTTELAWNNKYLNIEEAATILPVPDNVADDMEINVWDEAMPYMIEALGRLVDVSVFFGVNAPASFPTNIAAAAAAAGNAITEGTVAASGGYMADIDLAIGAVESDGFDVSGFIGARSLRGKLRAARNSLGDRLDQGRISGDLKELDGLPIAYPMRGLFPTTNGAGLNPRLFVGDWSQFVLGIRKDITVDVFREGVINDANGAIVYNLMQQDMTAIRITFRMGWQVANLITNDQPVDANRYPVATLAF